MRLRIRHTTQYRFDSPETYGLQQVRKTPKPGAAQSVLSWSTRIEGGVKELSYEDHHRNTVELISFEKGTETLLVTSEGEVELSETHGVVGPHPGPAPLWLYRRVTPRTKPGPAIRALVREVTGDTPLERLHMLMKLIGERVDYQLGATDSASEAERVLTEGKGVCQDHAHVYIACAREMGLPARYVSGYLLMDDRVEQEAMHAWAETHVDGLGWVGFDVSNCISPDTRYVRVATGLDYADAAPVTGTRTGQAGEAMNVAIEVAQQ
ncbi:transglutaminase family protein [Pseudoponticoccus marisrubri]|uniref:Transglutaminase n=1 Tax=Pseudoponticoccus marisrubri TaxID=1685382 RepID=A0A0W7WPD3_9RHOB|nr:transglutaminase family protein [Pseudoponticoccus marisrubri]KUF12467.1 transglutaminase [Pseudoponticoccus marisrubri]